MKKMRIYDSEPLQALETKRRSADCAPRTCLAKPCAQNCPKCGGKDINREHRERGETIEHGFGEDAPTKDKPPYLQADWPYGYKATKEHIGHHCRTCGFEWESAVLPNAAR